MAGPSSTVDQNLLPVQAYFDVYGNFQTFIGQGQPFYASINPSQSGLHITNSTIDSSTIGATTPSTGVFTNISTTTGQISNAPVNPADITNKLYVDTVAQGLAPKAACKVGTLTSITLSGLQTIDGYTTLAGDRVLVKNQGTTSQNGIYIASASAWTRAVDMDVWAEVPGAYTVLLNGSQANTGWVSTSADTGTINVTPITFVQFSGNGTYFAGTGLTLAANTFSITPVGTAGTYGSASSVPVFVTNASGQVTSVTNTSIAIANTQVSGLGTMSTQNANAVAITGGTINTATIGQTTAGLITGTTITANTQFTGPGTGLTGTAAGLSIGGNAATATSSGSVTNSVTFTNTGGAASGTTYNGSVARTIDYSTLGAPSTTGTGASGTWGIGITGNAGTVTNGVYTTGSYSNPAWITSILGSIVSGAVASATLATTATNIGGGTAGALPYNTGAGATSFLSLGTTNYVLTAGASAPQYVAQSTLSVGSATNATNATYLVGGVAGAVVWQSATGVTGFTAAGTTGQFLQSNGTGTPTWATPVSYATVTDDTSTAGTRYPLFANQTSGSLSTEYTSSTKLQYNPSTGIFTSTGFSGSGASLTALNASNVSSGTLGTSFLSGSYTGITGVGTLTAGTWNATAIGVVYGGTGLTSTPANGALDIGNGTGFTRTTLTAGSGIAITNGAGSISIASTVTGVTIADDTSSATAYYPLFARITTGTATTEYTSSTNLQYTPSTGLLSALLLTSTGTLTAGSASAQYIQAVGDALYPQVKAVGSGPNIPLVLSPLGTGALQAQKTDSTATGGNARGANAVDWQTSRGSATQVASGIQTVVGGGASNSSTGFASFVGAGNSNTANGTYSFVGAGNANTANNQSAIVGGISHAATGYFNFIGGGAINAGTSSVAVTTQATNIAVTAGTTLYLTSTNANIKVGQLIVGTGVSNNTYATSTVTTGTAAVMNTSTISGTTLTVGSLASGTIIAGMVLTGTGVTAGTYIVSGAGSTWTVSTSQTVSSTTITGTAYTFTISQNATTAAGVTLSFYTPHGVVVGGGNNQATGAYSFIGGGGDAGTATNRNAASGDFSCIVGGLKNVASGTASFIGGGGWNGSSANGNTASGSSSGILSGVQNQASNNNASVLGGTVNTASGSHSSILGGSYATTRAINGNIAFGSYTALGANQGLAQSATLVLARQTTDATATVLCSDSGAVSTTNQVILPNNSAYYFKVRVIAGVTGAGNTKAWTLEGAIKRGAGVGTTAIVGTVTTTIVAADVGAATWTVTATADTTNGGLAITVTGQASTTIRWVAKAETAEMTF